MRHIAANTFAIGSALALLEILGRVAIQGRVTFAEPNSAVLAVEITMVAGIFIFCTVNLIGIMRELRRQ